MLARRPNRQRWGVTPADPSWCYSPRGSLPLDRPRILGVINLTPDSFSDGGRTETPADAVRLASKLIADGADMLDIGGESTRPGAQRVDAAEQIRRTEPAIRAIRAAGGVLGAVPISIDTTLTGVARAALDAGADAINDVSAGREDDDLFPLAAERGAGLILMHRAAPPGVDSYSDRYASSPRYSDVVAEVGAFLRARADGAIAAGIDRAAIVLDPGLGFGKSVEQNVELVRRTYELVRLGFPVLSAASRKSFVGRVSLERDSAPSERLAGSIAFSVAHFAAGARLFRVHDVREQAEALRAAHALGMNETARGA